MIANTVDATWSSIDTVSDASACTKADQAPSLALVISLAPAQAPVLSLAQ